MYPNPGFPIYRSVIEFSGATPVPIPLLRGATASRSRADEVLAKITPRTRLIIINSPANPTGGVVPREELDALVAGPRAPPAGRGAVRRDLRAHALRRRAACQPARYPELARPADPARRLEQDLRDDRLAPGLRGLAQATWSSTPSGLRSTAIPASTPRPNGPASRRSNGPQDAVDRMVARLRRAPQGDRRAR